MNTPRQAVTRHRRSPRGIPKNPTIVWIRRQLLRWYDLHRRDLPWRQTTDPYGIWVSEVMLQQTRVQAVIPYYENFLHRFPDVKKLADASDQELLACWSGLGYYSRARNLQKAARVMVRDHSGKFPGDFAAALALPGIGRYTASAVLSIAYGAALPVLDGNVSRVLSRLYAVAADLKTAGGNERLRQLAGDLISARRPGDFNQAMMELGATVCLPQQPQCEQCPVRRNCLAYARNEVEKYPPRRRTGKPVVRRFVAAVVQNKASRVLLVRRSSKAKWFEGFWELPMWEPSREMPWEWIDLEERLGTVRHSITQNRLKVAVFSASVRERHRDAQWRWADFADFRSLPVTTITRKALALWMARRTPELTTASDPCPRGLSGTGKH
ncbi:MAG: A/G-specific adenine glycosylase [Acidobacteria bacterium]|nr:A/G-specific adenine glycosylase [Acidobacteriota bacterium]